MLLSALQLPVFCLWLVLELKAFVNQTQLLWLKVHSHATSVFAIFFDLGHPILKNAKLSANTITCCHGPHSLCFTQTQTLRVNKVFFTWSEKRFVVVMRSYWLRHQLYVISTEISFGIGNEKVWNLMTNQCLRQCWCRKRCQNLLVLSSAPMHSGLFIVLLVVNDVRSRRKSSWSFSLSVNRPFEMSAHHLLYV